MIDQPTQRADFFYAGGTMRPDTPSYVPRPADRELLECVLAGRFSYILTSRQMGKSSLMIRTAAKLDKAGVKTAIVDLSAIGTEVTAQQWYLDVALSISEELGLSIDLLSWWQAQTGLGPVKCFTNFLRDVILQEIEGNVVIFVDEIDSTLNLEFADDFFAAIRAIYNARARDPIFNRLTLVLIGVATPNDLIQDEKRTPFNVGQAIALQDFSRPDAQILQDGLEQIYPGHGERIFDRIFYWTAGHPYLTQKLCVTITEDTTALWSESDVDALVNRLFLTSKAAEKEDNLQFVRKNVASSSHKRDLLQLYGSVYAGRPPQNNDRDLTQNQLKLIGLARPEAGSLKVRNRIYQHVFDDKWISENMPPPSDRSQHLVMSLVSIIVVLFAIIFVPVLTDLRVPWNPNFIQARTLRENILNTTSADAQMTNLARLIETGYPDMAQEAFFNDLTSSQQIDLFKNANIEQVGSDTITVVGVIYDSASADVRIALLAKLFESEGYKEQAESFLFDQLSADESVDLFRKADPQKVGPEIITVFKSIAHSASADVRIAALAALFQAKDHTAKGSELFFRELSLEERIVLFQNADPQAVGSELLIAANAIYPHLNNTQNNNKLLAVMASTLHQLNRSEATALAAIIELWFTGREAYRKADYELALNAFDDVIKSNPAISDAYFDRALVYVDLSQFEEALADLDAALELDQTKAVIIGSTIYDNVLLSRFWSQSAQKYQTLQALIPMGGYATSVSVLQATEAGTTNVVYESFDKSGEPVPQCSASFILTQGQSHLVSLGQLGNCPAGFEGSGVASADDQVFATSAIDVTRYGSEAQHMKRGSAQSISEPFPEFFLPLLETGTGSEYINSVVYVQNASSNALEAKISLVNENGKVFSERSFVLPPNGVNPLSISSIQDTIADPQGWSGAARIVTASEGYVAVSNLSCLKLDCTYNEGLSKGDHHWFIPGLVRSSPTISKIEIFSEVAIMNTSETARAEVIVAFRGLEIEKKFSLLPWGSIRISTKDLPNIPISTTAEIRTEGAGVVITARYLNFTDNQAAAYSGLAVGQGGMELFFPDVSWARERNADTTIYLQNLTDMQISPTLYLYDRVTSSEGNSTPPVEAKLESLGAYQTLILDVEKYLGERANIEWEGSAVIKGDAEMGAIIITRSDGAEQWATAYNAMPGER